MLLKSKKISKKRQKLIDEKNSSPISVGETVYVQTQHLYDISINPEQLASCKVLSIDGDKIEVADREHIGYKNYGRAVITRDKIAHRETFYIGADPFVNWNSKVRVINYSFESIIFNLGVLGDRDDDNYSYKGVQYARLNWNPIVYDKDGNIQYYQRPFVWSTKDKQLLIESIYQDIECGRILVRKRSWKEMDAMVDDGITEVGFNDIVDGKQRLNAIKCFVMDEFKDMHGNYFSDLSAAAQHKLGNNQLFGFAELPENCPDVQYFPCTGHNDPDLLSFWHLPGECR